MTKARTHCLMALVCLFFSLLTHNISFAADGLGWEILKSSTTSQGQAALTIKGKIKESLLEFDMESLMHLPHRTFEVTHPVRGNKDTYTGIMLDDLLDHLELDQEASYVIIRASNDYKAVMKIDDIKRYEYMISYKKDGKMYNEFPANLNRGPLAIAINFDKNPELDYDVYKHQLVWFVTSLTIQ